MSDYVVKVENLKTHFKLDEGTLKAVDGVDLHVSKRTTVGVIGESGCGKSVTALSILRIVPLPGRIRSGRILLSRNGDEPLDLASLRGDDPRIRRIRGKDISMVFQEPMTSLSPVHTVGAQISEAVSLHSDLEKVAIREYVEEMLLKVGISNPSQRFDDYPHQLSGGMRQRAMIAMALSCNPRLLIADEPTTALDVTVQAQILDLMSSLQAQYEMSILYITHDLGVIAELADQVNVMYLGRVVEQASTVQLFDNPLHPYTQLLLKSMPKIGLRGRTRLDAIEGTVPVPINPPIQCGFHSRCPQAMEGRCNEAVPALVEQEPGHSVRCFLHSESMEDIDE